MSFRKLQTAVLAAGLLCCCLGILGCGRKEPARRNNAQAQFTVDIHIIRTEPFRATTFATGSLLANESILLKAERAGIVKEILFREGQPVKAGDTLLLIDDSELQAQLAGAQARLELAQAVEKRDRSLFETRMLSAAEYEQSAANLHIVEAELKLIKAQLEKTRVVAPFDGIAGLRLVSPGAYLVPGTAIASLQDISSLKLDFTLPERYLPMIRTGQEATFRVSGHVETFTATITAIEPAVAVETRSMLLRATVPNTQQKLLPGSFAELQVTLEEDPKAILIPAIALVPGLKQQKVFVHADGVAREREVQIGERTAETVQILEGLQVGEELITSGTLQLRSGMKVRTQPASEPAKAEGAEQRDDGSLAQPGEHLAEERTSALSNHSRGRR
jgi:membrane fusion protein, multidrug efflux system